MLHGHQHTFKNHFMSHGLALSAQERTSALTAMQWIIYLAELEYNSTITFMGHKVHWTDAENLLQGKTPPEELKRLLNLKETDRKAYANELWQGLHRDLEEWEKESTQQKSMEQSSSIETGPGFLSRTFSNDIHDIVRDEIKRKTVEASDDWEALQRIERFGPPDWSEEKLRRKEAAKRLVHISQALKHLQSDELYVRTEYGLLPARQKSDILDKNQIVKHHLTDNIAKSTDGKFYNAEGSTLFHDIKGKEICLFIENVQEESLITAVNDFMQCLSVKTPFLATSLTVQVSPLLNGLQAPTQDPETDFRQEYLRKKYGYVDLAEEILKHPEMSDEAAKVAEEVATMKEEAHTFMEEGKKLIEAQNNALSDSKDINALSVLRIS